MKNLQSIAVCLLLCISISPIFSTNTEFQTDAPKNIVDNLLSKIDAPSAPRIIDDYIVFTANKDARFTGIAFDFENFVTIHPFHRLNTHGYNGETDSSVLFYVAQIPSDVKKISYRLVIDGLWTIDELNPSSYFDADMQVQLSSIAIPQKENNTTKTIKSDTVHFVYKGTSGQEIRLGGSFTNWDSWIYQMQEVKPGIYELDIPLPAGTWYYSFYSGSLAIIDKNNPNRAYTPDGRTASVITVN